MAFIILFLVYNIPCVSPLDIVTEIDTQGAVMAISFELKGKWKTTNKAGEFIAEIDIKGFPITIIAEFNPKTGEHIGNRRSPSAVIKDDVMPTVGDSIFVVDKPRIGKPTRKEHKL